LFRLMVAEKLDDSKNELLVTLDANVAVRLPEI
jgi:hypothetical protein